MEYNHKIAATNNLTFEQWHQPVQITNGDLAALVHTIGLFVKEEIAPLKARLEEMEVFKYVGVWKEGEQYHAGNFVTDHGSLWHCNCNSTSRPGSDPIGWTLAVKRGSDAKGASETRTGPRQRTSIPARRIG